MVRGFELFRERFADFGDAFIVIGGTACDLNLEAFGGFRRTKDIDMIIVTEKVDDAFAAALHQFLREGQYACYVTKDKKPHYYRFMAPKDSVYPAQIEMLSHSLFPERGEVKFSPISLSEGVRSLSAIVLDPAYYEFAKTHLDRSHGVPCLTTEALAVFKSAAYLNLVEERTKDVASVRMEDIHKHRNDVFRLIGALADGVTVSLPDSIRNRMAEFINVFTAANPEWSAIRASIGTLALDPSIYIAKYREVFGV